MDGGDHGPLDIVRAVVGGHLAQFEYSDYLHGSVCFELVNDI